MSVFSCFFFFSSRRRHTRWNCDWSSDVCSSDLKTVTTRISPQSSGYWLARSLLSPFCFPLCPVTTRPRSNRNNPSRSEERRVGKECRSRGSPYREKKKKREGYEGKSKKDRSERD